MPENGDLGLTSFAENPNKSVERDALVEAQFTRPEQVEKTQVEKPTWGWCKNKEGLSRTILAVFFCCILTACLLFTLFILMLTKNTGSEKPRDVPVVYTLPSDEDTSTAHARLLLPAAVLKKQMNFASNRDEITTDATFVVPEITEYPIEESDEPETTVPPRINGITTSTGFLKFEDNVDGEESETCIERLAMGSPSGVYSVQVGKKFDAFCDMDTTTGGWTVIQRRADREGSFHKRTMAEYENGFGNLKGNHWLGLEKLNLLAPSSRSPATLRIVLEGETCDASCSKRYPNIWVGEWDVQFGGKESGYKLTMSPMTSGNLTFNGKDPFFAGSNERPFSTVDHKADKDDLNCAQFRLLGPWWHAKVCSDVGLNGYYQTISEKYDTADRNQNAKRYFVWGFEKQTFNGYPYTIHVRKSTMLLKSV
ncbi:unnamed protein product [Caenorhabditis sp. 36 PRJEB53466]|nr:unnamed protein product [Caenorhabditis sp. 36 PRJEB53466]